MIPPASPEGGDRWIVLETIFKVDKRIEPEGGGDHILSEKWSPPGPKARRDRGSRREGGKRPS